MGKLFGFFKKTLNALKLPLKLLIGKANKGIKQGKPKSELQKKQLSYMRKFTPRPKKIILMEELPPIPPLLRITPESRKVYSINLTVNGRNFSEIHMDLHCFEGKSKKLITPELIYYFALKLDNNLVPFIPEDYKEGWEYFAEESIFSYQNKPYRLAWCWHDSGDFIGIRTCTRIKKVKKHKYDGKKNK